MLEGAASMYCKPPVVFHSKEWTINNKKYWRSSFRRARPGLIMQHIKTEMDGLYRVGDQNLLANRVLLKVWNGKENRKVFFFKFTEKEKILLQFLEKNPTITLSRFCRMAKISRQKAETILVKFILLKRSI